MTGLTAFLIILAFGFFFGAFLWGIDADFGDKKALCISNTFVIIGVLLIVVSIGMTVKLCNTPKPLYEYKVHLYYLGGSERTVTIQSVQDPWVKSYKGSYSLEWFDGFSPISRKRSSKA